MNDCLLESENFQITKSDNNKYLLLPVTKSQQQQAEKFVLKECGKDIDSLTQISSFLFYTLTHTQSISFHFLLFFKIKFERKLKNYLSPNFHPLTLPYSVSHCSIQCSELHFSIDAVPLFGREGFEMSCPECHLSSRICQCIKIIFFDDSES